MASAADRYRAIAWQYRHLPGDYGLRPHTVEIGIGSSTGTHTGDGGVTTVWTPIVESGGVPPKCHWLSDKELAFGQLAAGAVRVGPITPDFPGGGTSVATLTASAAATGQTRHLRITGPQHPSGALYAITGTDFSAALHFYITATPVGSAQGP